MENTAMPLRTCGQRSVRLLAGTAGWCLFLSLADVRGAEPPVPLTWKGHGTDISFVAFAGDGKRVVSGCFDHSIKVWDAATGKELATLQKKSSGFLMERLAVSPDGERVATGLSGDGVVTVWDLNNYQMLHRLADHKPGAWVAFSADGKTLATMTATEPLRFWDMATGKQTGTLKGKVEGTRFLCYSPDGKTLAIGTGNKILLWDIARGKESAVLEDKLELVGSLAFSPDGKLLASVHLETVALWDVTTGKLKYRLNTRKEAFTVKSLAFSPDGKVLAMAGSRSKAAHLWDVDNEQELPGLQEGERRFGYTLAFSRDGKRMVTGSGDGTISIWNLPERK
jgi:WD40 repeat protein